MHGQHNAVMEEPTFGFKELELRRAQLSSFVLQWSPMSDYIFFLQKNRSDEDPAVNVRAHRPAA